MSAIQKISNFIGEINEKLTKYFTIWLVYPLIIAISFEVLSRYFFNKPTVWAYDISWMLFGAMVFLGAGYVMKYDGHVRADILYNFMPEKMKYIVTILCYLVFFFPAMGGLVVASFNMAVTAFSMKETSASTIMHFPLWPIRSILCVSITLLVLQGLAKFLENIVQLIQSFQKTGGEITHDS